MAPATTTQASSDSSVNNNPRKRQAKNLTAVDVINKIDKLLKTLSEADRRRVLAFVNESEAKVSAEE